MKDENGKFIREQPTYSGSLPVAVWVNIDSSNNKVLKVKLGNIATLHKFVPNKTKVPLRDRNIEA